MGNWNDKITVKKGNIGEQIIKLYLEKKGYTVYKSITEGKHAFDNLCVKDKSKIIISEIKTKSRMNKYNATGFDYRNYEVYLNIYNKYKIEIFIFFVDEGLCKIYGNKLSVLMKNFVDKNNENYPKIITTKFGEKIILFSLETMIVIGSLEKNIVKELRDLSARKYEYQF